MYACVLRKLFKNHTYQIPSTCTRAQSQLLLKLKMDSISFSVEAVVRGYHVYRDIWIAAVGEVLPCEREPINAVDRFAVAVKKGLDIVGHVPKKISSICAVFFLRRGGTIDCHITGCRRYSADLIQGGLEV